MEGLYRLLALLAADVLAVIADALALIRLRLLPVADACCELAQYLLVDAGDRDSSLFRRDLEAVRDLHDDRMREAEGHDEVSAFDVGLVADAFDDELLREALVHALDHVENMSCECSP